MKKTGLVFLFLLIQSLVFGQKKGLTVYIFLSETCPICKSITPEVNKLQQEFGGLDVSFLGIFPNKKFSTLESRTAFAQKFGLKFPLQADSGQTLTQTFKATITPEVIVVDNQTNKILYRGMIDNSFAAIGKRRTVVTKFFLRSALKDWMLGKKPLLSNTEPVGCLIENQ